MKRFIARKLIAIAKQLISGKSTYIYDPQHKKKPSGGYVKTERGWTLKKEKTNKNQIPHKIKKTNYFKHKSASDPNTDIKTLEILSNDENLRVRARVANNPNTPKRILEKLSKDKQRIVRAAVAKNKKTPLSLIKELVGDKSYLVRREVVRNSKTPMGDLKKIFHAEIPKRSGKAPFTVKEEAKNKIKERLPNFSKNINPKRLKLAVAKLGDEEEEILENLGDFKKTLGPRGQGRNEAQLKADFIKNMNPNNYENQEAFNRAKERVSKMNVSDFATMLNSILLDDEEE